MFTQRKSHHSLVHNHGNKNRHQFSQFCLEPDRQALEQRVEGERNDEEYRSQGRVIKNVDVMAVTFFAVLMMQQLTLVKQVGTGVVSFD